MILSKSTSLASYLTHLLSRGHIVFTAEQAEQALGIAHGAFLDAAERLQKKGQLLNPRQGFYVVIPPQYLGWGGPPPSWYINDLMNHIDHPYYVGLLKAAEFHGAAHQAVMEFQVITEKRIPKIKAGRSTISFYYRKHLSEIEVGIEEGKTDTGKMKISSPELTALDLIRYPRASGGIGNIVTVLSELAIAIDSIKLMAIAKVFEHSVQQRLGYLLDKLGYTDKTEPLYLLLQQSNFSWIELDPLEVKDPDFTNEPIERDSRWHVIVRNLPEVDQ
jgi:predicted transcriptional regulator of viral defense system